MCYLTAEGKPLYSFQLQQLAGMAPGGAADAPASASQQQQQQAPGGAAQQGGWQLAYNPADPVLAAGGLAAVSEGGRLAGGGAAQEGSDSEEEEPGFGAFGNDDVEAERCAAFVAGRVERASVAFAGVGGKGASFRRCWRRDFLQSPRAAPRAHALHARALPCLLRPFKHTPSALLPAAVPPFLPAALRTRMRR